MKTLPGCEARQYSDQMQCRCGLCWDMNDPEPPQCGKMRPPVPSARERVLEQVGLSGGGCPCEPAGSDGLTCPDPKTGQLLCESETVVRVDKYEVRHVNGVNLRALRNGEPWRDLAGDNLVFALACRSEQLETLLRDLLQSGEWYASALEFDHGVDGEALRARVEAALL